MSLYESHHELLFKIYLFSKNYSNIHSFYSEFLTVQGGDYIREFLLTYPYVTTPELFLEQLQRLYNFVCPEDVVPEVTNYFETNRKAIQQK